MKRWFIPVLAVLSLGLAVFSVARTNPDRAPEAGQEGLVAELEVLTNSLLRFMQTPRGTIGAEANAALKRLPQAPAFQEDLRALVIHGRYLIAASLRMEALMRALMAAPTAIQARALQQALLRQHAKLEGRAHLFRLLLYLAAVALLSHLLYLFGRLRANARDLKLVNEGASFSVS